MSERYFSYSRIVGASAVAGGLAGWSLYWYIHSALTYESKTRKVIVASSRSDALTGLTSDLPYPPDVFPGGRNVETPYGTIKVFEWGPEDGEKIALVHGIGTPCIALGEMANEFVRRGNRVLLFDLFGRGYSDTPSDLPFDDRLYASQLLMALSSSPLPWAGNAAFHLIGFSLGGALAASFAAYFPHMLRSLTLVCPGGLIRPNHLSLRSRFLYSEGLLPQGLLRWLLLRRLQPDQGPSADVPDKVDRDVDFDNVKLVSGARVGDVMKWQLRGNEGLAWAYRSTIRNAPIYGEHDGLWKRLERVLSARRQASGTVPPGLPGGRICLILADKDPVVVASEWVADVAAVLGEDAADIRIIDGGHEIAIAKGKEVAELAMASWNQDYVRA